VIGHLGSRVSALLDGRLPAGEEERAWEHVHVCHPCRDLVEREGWVKTRLAELGHGSAAAPSSLKQSLTHHLLTLSPEAFPTAGHETPAGARPRTRSLVALGAGAVGVSVVGVLALGAAPANTPPAERRAPVTSLVRPTPTLDQASRESPTLRPGASREKMGP
jgi:hypothetical protein